MAAPGRRVKTAARRAPRLPSLPAARGPAPSGSMAARQQRKHEPEPEESTEDALDGLLEALTAEDMEPPTWARTLERLAARLDVPGDNARETFRRRVGEVLRAASKRWNERARPLERPDAEALALILARQAHCIALEAPPVPAFGESLTDMGERFDPAARGADWRWLPWDMVPRVLQERLYAVLDVLRVERRSRSQRRALELRAVAAQATSPAPLDLPTLTEKDKLAVEILREAGCILSADRIADGIKDKTKKKPDVGNLKRRLRELVERGILESSGQGYWIAKAYAGKMPI